MTDKTLIDVIIDGNVDESLSLVQLLIGGEYWTLFFVIIVFGFIILSKMNKLADVFIYGWNILLKRTIIYSPKAILISKLAYWSEFKINKITLHDPGRNLIFRDLLSIRFNILKLHVFDIEKVKNLDNISRQELYTLILECINNTLVKFKERSKEEGIPIIVVDKFLDWHTESIELVLRSAELMVESPVYKTNRDVISAIYLLQTAMLEISISEAEKALSTLNGSLTGIKYKGLIIGE